MLCLRILLQLVTHKRIEESDHEVEDHGRDTVGPECLDKRFLFGVELFLCLEQGLFLALDCIMNRARKARSHALD